MGIKRILLLLLLVPFAAACVKEEPSDDSVSGKTVLTASFAEPTTRTGFDNGGTFMWRTNDRIRVAATDGTTLDFRYSGANTAGAAEFEETESSSASVLFGDGGFAVYPSLASGNCILSGNSRTLNLKNNYTWAEGNVEAPMISKVLDAEDLKFSHLGGLLKLTLANIPVSAAKLMVHTPGMPLPSNYPYRDGTAVSRRTALTYNPMPETTASSARPSRPDPPRTGYSMSRCPWVPVTTILIPRSTFIWWTVRVIPSPDRDVRQAT